MNPPTPESGMRQVRKRSMSGMGPPSVDSSVGDMAPPVSPAGDGPQSKMPRLMQQV